MDDKKQREYLEKQLKARPNSFNPSFIYQLSKAF